MSKYCSVDWIVIYRQQLEHLDIQIRHVHTHASRHEYTCMPDMLMHVTHTSASLYHASICIFISKIFGARVRVRHLGPPTCHRDLMYLHFQHNMRHLLYNLHKWTGTPVPVVNCSYNFIYVNITENEVVQYFDMMMMVFHHS